MRGFINDFKGWNKFEYLWLTIAVGSIFGLELIWKDTPMGIISAVSNIVCVILVAKNKISSYFFAVFKTFQSLTWFCLSLLFGFNRTKEFGCLSVIVFNSIENPPIV